ncbi:MAG: HEAT repeat domain-containing protein [Parachlamydiales bacterium]|jgi:HEAT repeat protein
MGLLKTFLKITVVFNLFIFGLHATENDKNHILYLMHSQEVEKAFSQYQKYYENEALDLDILQKMCLILIKTGAKSGDAEIQKLSMFGAGLCASNISLDILETGLSSPILETQLLSLYFISLLNDNKTDKLLTTAMRSDFLPTRLEAAYHMALRKHPNAIGQIESLMFKLPNFLKPFFPHLFALIGTDDATKYLLRFLSDPNPDVRLETILSIGNLNRDDLLSHIRKKIPNSTTAEKEAICYSLYKLKDSSCNDELNKLSKSNIENVQMSSLRALYNLGDFSKKDEIEKLALENNLFAISLLQEIPDSDQTLEKLLKSANPLVKINSALSLLKHKNPICLNTLKDILITSSKDSALEPFFSVGHTMMYFKIVPVAMYKIKENSNNQSLAIRESILKECLELKEDDFFKIIEQIFQAPQNDLIPTAIVLLENLGSAAAIDFLKHYAKNSNIPLIRDYANLSLYRLKQDGPYESYISNWIRNQNNQDLIQLNVTDDKKQKKQNIYSLTKEETTRLLLDMYVAVASKQDKSSLKLIIDSIKRTNPKNRYALAGMLIRATQ